jgi:hypothetical protein
MRRAGAMASRRGMIDRPTHIFFTMLGFPMTTLITSWTFFTFRRLQRAVMAASTMMINSGGIGFGSFGGRSLSAQALRYGPKVQI